MGDRKVLKRVTLPFDFVLLVCCAFVFLTMGAMALYPGGTALDPRTSGYQFFENFFSDLGRTIARGGKPNPVGSRLFFLALVGAGLALGVFFVAFARFFWEGLAQRVATTAGVLFGLLSAGNFIGIAVYPSNLYSAQHGYYVFGAFKFFPLAVFFFVVSMLLSRTYPKRGVWIFVAFFAVLLAYLRLITAGPLPDSPSGLLIQSAGQKAVVYASLLCVGFQALLARRHLSARSQSNHSS